MNIEILRLRKVLLTFLAIISLAVASVSSHSSISISFTDATHTENARTYIYKLIGARPSVENALTLHAVIPEDKLDNIQKWIIDTYPEAILQKLYNKNCGKLLRDDSEFLPTTQGLIHSNIHKTVFLAYLVGNSPSKKFLSELGEDIADQISALECVDHVIFVDSRINRELEFSLHYICGTTHECDICLKTIEDILDTDEHIYGIQSSNPIGFQMSVVSPKIMENEAGNGSWGSPDGTGITVVVADSAVKNESLLGTFSSYELCQELEGDKCPVVADLGDNEEVFYDHGSHVVGSIGLQKNSYQAFANESTFPNTNASNGYMGIAPNATIKHISLMTGTAASPYIAAGSTLMSYWKNQFGTQFAIFSNSWGNQPISGPTIPFVPASWGFRSLSVELDRLSSDKPKFVFFQSAGNEARYLTGAISSPSDGRNVISVGASQSFAQIQNICADEDHPDYPPGVSSQYCTVLLKERPETLAWDTPAIFSSVGPTVDGRYRPLVMSPGSEIGSLNWKSTTTPRFLSGTSMATPILAGTFANVVQSIGYEPTNYASRAAAIAAAKQNTAAREALYPIIYYTNSNYTWSLKGGHEGDAWDAQAGWGRVRAEVWRDVLVTANKHVFDTSIADNAFKESGINTLSGHDISPADHIDWQRLSSETAHKFTIRVTDSSSSGKIVLAYNDLPIDIDPLKPEQQASIRAVELDLFAIVSKPDDPTQKFVRMPRPFARTVFPANDADTDRLKDRELSENTQVLWFKDLDTAGITEFQVWVVARRFVSEQHYALVTSPNLEISSSDFAPVGMSSLPCYTPNTEDAAEAMPFTYCACKATATMFEDCSLGVVDKIETEFYLDPFEQRTVAFQGSHNVKVYGNKLERSSRHFNDVTPLQPPHVTPKIPRLLIAFSYTAGEPPRLQKALGAGSAAYTFLHAPPVYGFEVNLTCPADDTCAFIVASLDGFHRTKVSATAPSPGSETPPSSPWYKNTVVQVILGVVVILLFYSIVFVVCLRWSRKRRLQREQQDRSERDRREFNGRGRRLGGGSTLAQPNAPGESNGPSIIRILSESS